MLTGQIRMIKYGIIPMPSPSFQISVGQLVGGRDNSMRVVQIVREDILEGKCEYHIECSKVIVKPGSKDTLGNPFVWKTYYKEPDEVQYFSPDESHNFLVI